eukprot:TRINITY_DN2428_c0_g1_i7.p1 TRINITY_DN2428_c0_g1~~TRINITY_DN2428_c0_g1_i7.p1  ORF type:complete len:141 (-),score=8.56 TRINITY_DN2428_c0_g1_i7:12-434(-)
MHLARASWRMKMGRSITRLLRFSRYRRPNTPCTNRGLCSLGSQCVMKFTPKRSAQEAAAVPLESFSVFLPRRSLLLFERTLYTQYLHEIENLAEDQIDSKVLGAPPELAGVALPRGLRVSLTIRNVKKVLRAAIHLGNRR